MMINTIIKIKMIIIIMLIISIMTADGAAG